MIELAIVIVLLLASAFLIEMAGALVLFGLFLCELWQIRGAVKPIAPGDERPPAFALIRWIFRQFCRRFEMR